MKKVNNSDEIIKLRKDGLSYKQICDKTGLSKGTVSKYCRGLNENFAKYENPFKFDKKDIDKAQKIYDSGMSLREVGKIVGITRQTLSKYLNIKEKISKKENESKRDDVERVKKWKKNLRNEIVQKSGGKCVICGYNKSIRALHFHHLDPKEKDFRISIGSISKELLLNEIKKCILVCSNCHCEIHDEMYEKGYSETIKKMNL